MIEILFRCLNESNQWTDKVTLKRNELLIAKGAIEKNVYFVESGTVRAFMVDGVEEHTIRFGYTGSIFTALDSLLSGKPTQYSIQAIKSSELLAVSKDQFFSFIYSDPKYQKLYQAMLEQFVLQQMEREEDLLTTSPAERYQRVLNRSPHLFQEVPNKYIASYLRMTPETLSRLKSNEIT